VLSRHYAQAARIRASATDLRSVHEMSRFFPVAAGVSPALVAFFRQKRRWRGEAPQSKRAAQDSIPSRRWIEPTNLRTHGKETLTRLSALLIAASLGGCVSDGMRMVDGHVGNAVSLVSGAGSRQMSHFRRFDAAFQARRRRAHFSLTRLRRSTIVPASSVRWRRRSARHFWCCRSATWMTGVFGKSPHVSGASAIPRDVLLRFCFNTESRRRASRRLSPTDASPAFPLFTWVPEAGCSTMVDRRRRQSRDALEKFVVELSRRRSRTVHVLAHSMGAWRR
jgi:hypothetical protein